MTGGIPGVSGGRAFSASVMHLATSVWIAIGSMPRCARG
jgi:hypothetical protein